MSKTACNGLYGSRVWTCCPRLPWWSVSIVELGRAQECFASGLARKIMFTPHSAHPKKKWWMDGWISPWTLVKYPLQISKVTW